MRFLLIFAILALCVYVRAQPVTVLPPQSIVSDTLPAGVLAHWARATSGGTCHADSTTFCVGVGSPNTPLNNGLLVFNSDGTPGTPLTTALASIRAGTATNDYVVVLTAGAKYDFPNGHAPSPWNFSGGNSCAGNTDWFDITCRGRMPQTVQFLLNVGNPQYIDWISTAYGLLPPQGTRVLPIDGDGYSSPLGLVHNTTVACTAHTTAGCAAFATISTPDGSDPIFFGSGPAYYRFIGIEVTSDSTSGSTPLMSLGRTTALVYEQGAGFTGGRPLHINNGGTVVFADGVLQITFGQPFIRHCHVASAVGPDCAAVNILPSVNTDLYFEAGFTHFVAGQSYFRASWSGRQQPASDITVVAETIGSGAGQCPTGATLGGDVMGNVCVLTPTTAKVTINPTQPATFSTCNTGSPATAVCYNSGNHSYFIDTVPVSAPSVFHGACTGNPCVPTWVGGGNWAAGTEHAPTNDIIRVGWSSGLPARMTITGCTPNCAQSSVDSAWLMPNDTTTRTFTVTGIPSTTNWLTSHLLTFGNTIPFNPVGSTTVNTTTQVATQQFVGRGNYVINRSPVMLVQANANSTTYGATAKFSSPNADIDMIYKGFGMTSNTSGSPVGIDFAAEAVGDGSGGVQYSRQTTNYGDHGGSFTIRAFAIGATWTIPNCTSGPCPNSSITNGLDFGSDVAIDSWTVGGGGAYVDITGFVCDGVTVHAGCTAQISADIGAVGVQWMRYYVHGSEGQILHTGVAPDPGPANTPCNGNGYDNGNGIGTYWICYETGAQEVVQAFVLNSPQAVLEDGYVSEILANPQVFQDSQAVNLGITSGPGLIKNNFLSADTENILFGGTGTPGQNSVSVGPLSYQVYKNYFYKPPYWFNEGISVKSSEGACGPIGGTHFNCSMSVKDNYEQKSGQQIERWGNIMDGQWLGVFAQYDSTVMTPRLAQSQGTMGTYASDINFHDDLAINVWSSLSMAASDQNCQFGESLNDPTCAMGAMPPAVLIRSNVENEAFIGNQNENTFAETGGTNFFFLQTQPMTESFRIYHDTFAFFTGITSAKGVGFVYNGASNDFPCGTQSGRQMTNLWIQNTVLPMGYTNSSGACPLTLTANCPSGLATCIAGNVFGFSTTNVNTGINTSGTSPNYIASSGDPLLAFTQPLPQALPASQLYYLLNVGAGFYGDYQATGPSSPYAGWIGPSAANTTDGATVGVNWTALAAAIADTPSGTPPGNLSLPSFSNATINNNAVIK